MNEEQRIKRGLEAMNLAKVPGFRDTMKALRAESVQDALYGEDATVREDARQQVLAVDRLATVLSAQISEAQSLVARRSEREHADTAGREQRQEELDRIEAIREEGLRNLRGGQAAPSGDTVPAGDSE